MGAGRAGGRKGRRSDKRAVRRRYGDIVSGNTKRCVCRGRAGERRTLSSPLLEGNGRIVITLLFIGRDAHLVVLKEHSAVLFVGDAGAGELTALDRHRIGRRAVAVGGEAVGLNVVPRKNQCQNQNDQRNAAVGTDADDGQQNRIEAGKVQRRKL